MFTNNKKNTDSYIFFNYIILSRHSGDFFVKSFFYGTGPTKFETEGPKKKFPVISSL